MLETSEQLANRAVEHGRIGFRLKLPVGIDAWKATGTRIMAGMTVAFRPISNLWRSAISAWCAPIRPGVAAP